uniref:THAP-type domain-containing protein n=1 Tax=Periophthalmus magnuspinnatus TaxID=409849 RepID=A0A3B3ZPW7_9GOBI
MPKNCSVPHCKTTPGNKKNFYKFPLHDPERLHLWLRNMGKNNWTPSRHQYICHKHFAPSNFKVCWGVRYLKNTAVPTLFQVNAWIDACFLLQKNKNKKCIWHSTHCGSYGKGLKCRIHYSGNILASVIGHNGLPNWYILYIVNKIIFLNFNSYHKNSVSKEQLQATVVELQRKMKLLQQRHCTHLEKLEELERTVGQLRQSKLLYEERLQRLERVNMNNYDSQKL